MLDTLRNLFPGASIAIVGSAPSALLFNHDEDVTIGVNGAAKLLRPGDYHLSCDETAYRRSWFLDLDESITYIQRAISALHSRRFYPDDVQRAGLEHACDEFFARNTNAVKRKNDDSPYVSVNENADLLAAFERTIPDCPLPNRILRAMSVHTRIARTQPRLNVGGTSACVALQLAHVMGAREAHLYGVEFSNVNEHEADFTLTFTGRNYFYTPLPGEQGMTNARQRDFMDCTIEEVMAQGTIVYLHGPSNLRLPLRR